jgi:site-specific recombinase XerD
MNDISVKPVVTGTELAIATAWKAVDVWLDAVRHNGGDYSEETANTYSYHVAKLRWYCEGTGTSPTQWTKADANAFVAFLRDLCRPIASAAESRPYVLVLVPRGSRQPVLRFARADEPGYTSLRTVPSSGSRDDILRCVRALFNQLHEDGVIRRNPMARLKTRKPRRISAERSFDLDL